VLQPVRHDRYSDREASARLQQEVQLQVADVRRLGWSDGPGGQGLEASDVVPRRAARVQVRQRREPRVPVLDPADVHVVGGKEEEEGRRKEEGGRREKEEE